MQVRNAALTPSIGAFIALFILGSPAFGAADAHYSVVMSGGTKGDLILTSPAPGEQRSVLRYVDRGRGPDLTATSRYDEAGLLVSFALDGLNYGKRPVSERFTVEGARAKWTSEADSGEAAAGGFYLPNMSNAADAAALARALLKTPARQLALLPMGTAGIRKVLDRQVAAGEARAKATLYFISGIGLRPQPIWLDDAGALFASGGTWLAVIKKGFEPAMSDLVVAQEDALAAEARERARTIKRKPSGPVVIRNAKVFDAEQRVLRPGFSVRVNGERIEAVGPDARVDTRGAEVIDASGKVLLPGMWDMHVHVLSQDEGVTALLAGLTSVRDLGHDPATLTRITQQFDDGTLVGPRVIRAGLIDGRGQFAVPTGSIVGTVDEMRAAVNAYADRGYRQVKLYASLSPELMHAGIAAARARGLRVSGHVPTGLSARDAVLAGYDELQHANYPFLNFMGPEVLAQTQTPVRFSAVYEHAHELDLESPAVRDFIALLKQKGTVVDPTLVTFETMFTGWKGEMSAWVKPWVDRLPPLSLRDSRGGGRATTPEQRTAFTESFNRMKQMVKALHSAGVQIVPGTDGGAMLYSRELELYVEAGIPTQDVLYLATLGSARVAQEDKNSGSIAAGKRADLVLIDGDPVARIGDVRRTQLVFKAGVIHDARALALAAGLTQ
jgi:imidazolonepropionase-like amidohydrolase